MKTTPIKYLVIALITTISTSATAQQTPTQFPEAALNDTLTTLQSKPITLKTILNTYKGHPIIINIWASWCKDCQASIPKVKALQAEYPKVQYLFLSLDKTQKAWKHAIKNNNIKGAHYLITSGQKGPLATFLHLDYIPRYIILDRQNHIKLFKAISPNARAVKDITYYITTHP